MHNHQPTWVCHYCGEKHGRRPPSDKHLFTWHIGECCVCGKTCNVTEPRDYGYLREGWQGGQPE